MADPVSLIPRSSKTTKKRRPGFRPAAKKSNQNKNNNNKTTQSTTTTSKVSDATIETNNSLKVSAQIGTAASSSSNNNNNNNNNINDGKITNDERSKEVSESLSTGITSNTEEKIKEITETESNDVNSVTNRSSKESSVAALSISKESYTGNDCDSSATYAAAAVAVADTTSTTDSTTNAASTKKNAISWAETTSTGAITTTSTNTASSTKKNTISNRKRKIITPNNKRIRVGTSFQTKSVISTPAPSSTSPIVKNQNEDADGTNQKSTAICVTTPDPQQQQQQQQNTDENNSLMIVETKKASIATNISTSSAIIPALSSHDQAILNQINEENANEEENNVEGSRMNMYCSRFKGPKRKVKGDKDGSSKKSSQNGKKNYNDNSSKVTDTAATGAATGTSDSTTTKDSNSSNIHTNNNTTTTNGAPVVQIIDGEIVLQESSVMLPARRSVQEVEEEYQDNVVEEDAQMAIVQASYNSFLTKGDHGKTRKTGNWSTKETKRFYVALQQLGPDFGSMEALFFENQRTRRQLKHKYQKELSRNSNFVQELALNPKYQIDLDMTAFNVEVDPKRIEAHENEEAPIYEPTDGNNTAMVSSTKTGAGNNDPSNIGREGEVVEEDADEERRAELAAEEARRTTSSVLKDASFWSTTGGDQDKQKAAEAVDAEIGVFPRAEEEFAGPNMDDFFHDESFGNDHTNEFEEEKSTAAGEEEKSTEPKGVAPARINSEQLVSLVPKKTNAKSRRPKIRPSSRKKK